jgi:hypothetical protein
MASAAGQRRANGRLSAVVVLTFMRVFRSSGSDGAALIAAAY